MNKKCNYQSFFNEFNCPLKKQLWSLPMYNGYYFKSTYKKNLQNRLEKFKSDLLYELPFNKEGDKEVFLRNLYSELLDKQCYLKLNQKRILERKRKTRSISISLRISDRLSRKKDKQAKFMHNKQLVVLNNALNTIEQTAIIFGYTFIKIEPKAILNPNLGWDGGKVGMIQLVKALVKSELILLGKLTETEAINLISNAFNVSLNKNNFSSFSRAIHSSNNDYQPSIFKRIKAGYDLTTKELIDKYERNRK